MFIDFFNGFRGVGAGVKFILVKGWRGLGENLKAAEGGRKNQCVGHRNGHTRHQNVIFDFC